MIKSPEYLRIKVCTKVVHCIVIQRGLTGFLDPQLVEGRRDEIPLDCLDEIEICTLHWMVSYAVNKTLRMDEVEFFTENQYRGPGRLTV